MNFSKLGDNKYGSKSKHDTKNDDQIILYIDKHMSINVSLKHLSRPSEVYTEYIPASYFARNLKETCFLLTIAVDAEEAKKLNIYPTSRSTKIFYLDDRNSYSFFEFRFSTLKSATQTKKIIEEQRIMIFDSDEQRIMIFDSDEQKIVKHRSSFSSSSSSNATK